MDIPRKIPTPYEEGYIRGRQDAVEEIFKEVDELFRKHFDSCSKPVLSILEPIRQGERFVINEIWHDTTNLKKKYTEG